MIKKVGLIGAGAIGAYFIDCLENVDCELVVIASGSRKERLEKQGIYVNRKHHLLNVKSEEECGKVDLLLVATKYNGLDEVCKILPILVKEDTIVLSLLNGVDSEEILGNVIDPKQIVYSLMRISSQRVDDKITYNLSDGHGLFYGSENEEQLKVLDEFFSKTPVLYTVEKDIKTDIWLKYASNIANNLPQAILQAPSIVYSFEHAYFIASKLWEEVRKVAYKEGIILSEKPLIFNVAKSAKFSTLQDIEAKRHTEIDMFAKVLMDKAGKYGIEVPYTTMTYHLIKALEEKNDGLYNI